MLISVLCEKGAKEASVIVFYFFFCNNMFCICIKEKKMEKKIYIFFLVKLDFFFWNWGKNFLVWYWEWGRNSGDPEPCWYMTLLRQALDN